MVLLSRGMDHIYTTQRTAPHIAICDHDATKGNSKSYCEGETARFYERARMMRSGPQCGAGTVQRFGATLSSETRGVPRGEEFVCGGYIGHIHEARPAYGQAGRLAAA